MAKRITLTLVFGAALALSVGQAFALNPQPLPPGDKLPAVQHNLQTEPPDPCSTGGHGNAMVMHNGAHMAMGPADSSSPKLDCMHNGAHQLNPQPLPPG